MINCIYCCCCCCRCDCCFVTPYTGQLVWKIDGWMYKQLIYNNTFPLFVLMQFASNVSLKIIFLCMLQTFVYHVQL